MALTRPRWALLLGLGCALMAIAFLPPRQVRYPPYLLNPGAEPLDGEIARSERHLREAARAVVLAEELQALRSVPPAAIREVEVGVRGPWPGPLAAALDSATRRVWGRLPQSDSTVRLRVIWYQRGHGGEADAIDPARLQHQAQVVLPPWTDGRSCLLIIPFYRSSEPESPATLGRRATEALRSLLGPCALYAEFGPPGASVERWLLRTGFALGWDVGWGLGGYRPRQPWWRELGGPDEVGLSGAAIDLLRRLAGEPHPAYRLPVGAARCLTDARRCRGLLEDSALVPPPRPGGQLGVLVRSPNRWEFDMRTLGQSGGQFLGDVIAVTGRERFRKFWTSRGPVEPSLTEALGVPVEEWTRDWLRVEFGSFEAGAPVTWDRLLWVLFLAAALTGLTAWGATQRSVLD